MDSWSNVVSHYGQVYISQKVCISGPMFIRHFFFFRWVLPPLTILVTLVYRRRSTWRPFMTLVIGGAQCDVRPMQCIPLPFGNDCAHTVFVSSMFTLSVVHRCGTSGSMRACHAAGTGSIPGRDKFPGWGFFGVFPHLEDKCQETLAPQGLRISFGHHYHPLSFHYGRQWPQMLTRPESSNVHTYKRYLIKENLQSRVR